MLEGNKLDKHLFFYTWLMKEWINNERRKTARNKPASLLRRLKNKNTKYKISLQKDYMFKIKKSTNKTREWLKIKIKKRKPKHHDVSDKNLVKRKKKPKQNIKQKFNIPLHLLTKIISTMTKYMFINKNDKLHVFSAHFIYSNHQFLRLSTKFMNSVSYLTPPPPNCPFPWLYGM